MSNIIPLKPRKQTCAPTPEQLELLLARTMPEALSWARDRMMPSLLAEELPAEELPVEADLAELAGLAEELPGEELVGEDALAELARLDACWDVYGELLHEYLDGRLPLADAA